MTFKTQNRILKPFLGAITISAYSLCEGNLVPRINAVLIISFVWSIRRVQNKYQQTKQVNRKHDNHCYSFYFSEAKCKGPIFGPLLSELRWNIFSTVSEERKARVRISDPCFLIRDEIFFHYFSGAKSKGPKFGSLLFKHRFLFTILAERKARVQNSDPCFLKKDEVFFPLLPREAKSKGSDPCFRKRDCFMPCFITSAEWKAKAQIPDPWFPNKKKKCVSNVVFWGTNLAVRRKWKRVNSLKRSFLHIRQL